MVQKVEKNGFWAKIFLTPQPARGLGLRRGATPKPKIFKIANFYPIFIFSTLIFRKNVS